MTTSKLPADLLRARLAKRTSDHIALANKVTPEHLLKSPSQKHSEAGRKKELKRSGISGAAGVEDVPSDCFDCPKKAGCGKLLELCGERHLILRCAGCKRKVRARIDVNRVWEYCPVCRVRKNA